jgi:hypothetical protein
MGNMDSRTCNAIQRIALTVQRGKSRLLSGNGMKAAFHIEGTEGEKLASFPPALLDIPLDRFG